MDYIDQLKKGRKMSRFGMKAKLPPKPKPFRDVAKKFRRPVDIALREGIKLHKSNPDMSSSEFRSELKRIVDKIIELPPIAEEISDVVISVAVDLAAYRIRAKADDFVIIEKAEYGQLKKMATSDGIVVDRNDYDYLLQCRDFVEKARKEKNGKDKD